MADNKLKIYLYIDGTNLFAGQTELFGYQKILPFSQILSEIKKLLPVDKIFFYASYMGVSARSKPNLKKLIGIEAQFYKEVKRTPNLTFYKGHRSPSSGREKGVDVHLAADIIKDAFLKKYDQMAIMTGDADLIYPVEIVKNLGLKTHALFFPNRFSLELAFKADYATVLNYEDKFNPFGRKLPKNLKIIAIKKPRM